MWLVYCSCCIQTILYGTQLCGSERTELTVVNFQLFLGCGDKKLKDCRNNLMAQQLEKA